MTDTTSQMAFINLLYLTIVLLTVCLALILGILFAMQRLIVPNDRWSLHVNLSVEAPRENEPSTPPERRSPAKREYHSKTVQKKQSSSPAQSILSSSPQSLRKSWILGDDDELMNLEPLPPPRGEVVNNASQEITVGPQQRQENSAQYPPPQQDIVHQQFQVGTTPPHMGIEVASRVRIDSPSKDSAIDMTFDSPPTLVLSDQVSEETNKPEAHQGEAIEQQNQHEDTQQPREISITGFPPSSDPDSSVNTPERGKVDFIATAGSNDFVHPPAGLVQISEDPTFQLSPLGETQKSIPDPKPVKEPEESSFSSVPLEDFTDINAPKQTSSPSSPTPSYPKESKESKRDLLEILGIQAPLFQVSSGPHFNLQVRKIVHMIKEVIKRDAELELDMRSGNRNEQHEFLDQHHRFLERFYRLLDEENRDTEDIAVLHEVSGDLEEFQGLYCIALWDLVKVLLCVIGEKVGYKTAPAVRDILEVNGAPSVDPYSLPLLR
jgi:hypothetical protein